MVNLTGSTRAETITGGAGSDSIVGGAGNDFIRGDNLIANGTFEGNTIVSGYSSGIPSGWTRHLPHSPSTDLPLGQQIHPYTTGAGQYLDTANRTNAHHGLAQDTGVRYNSAQSYNLTMDLGSQFTQPAPVHAEILVGGVVVATQTYTFPGFTTGSMITRAININLAAGVYSGSGAIAVRFYVRSVSGHTQQVVVDNVSLTSNGPEVGAADTLDGGLGNDTLYGGTITTREDNARDYLRGGDGFDHFVVGTEDVIVDFNTATGGNINDGIRTNNDFVDLSAYYNPSNLEIVNAARIDAGLKPYGNPLAWMRGDQADDGILNDITTANDFTSGFEFTILNNSAAVAGDALTLDNAGVVCFASGTEINTSAGPIPVEKLKVGQDLILTADHGYKAIKWIGSRKISAEEMRRNPKLRPIRIRAQALGDGLPLQDLIVSQNHRILVKIYDILTSFAEETALIAAKHLLDLSGVELAEDIEEVEYWHFLFDQHEVVWANGAQSESLYAGKETIKLLNPEAVEEIFTILPELALFDEDNLPKPARRLLNVKDWRLMQRSKEPQEHHPYGIIASLPFQALNPRANFR